MLSFMRSLFSDIAFNQLGGITLFGTMNKTKSATNQPAPTTPPPVELEDEESNDLAITTQSAGISPSETINSEVNFLTLPFFTVSRHDKRLRTEYRAIETRGDKRLDVYWKVSANSEYGYPRPFDRQVHKAIEYIISNLPRPIQNPVPIGSLYRIAKLLGLRDSGQVYRDIKAALQRINATTIETNGTFYSKGEQEFVVDQFHLYERIVLQGKRLPNGKIADTNYVFLSSWYLDNINNRYVRPLDYTYYRSLQAPIASRLYELLGVKFYGMGKYPYIRYRYSNLCQLLPVTQYQRVSKAKEILNPAHEELRITGFFDRVEWGKIEGESRDWYVYYYAGTRAKEEIRQANERGKRGNNHVALPPPDDSVPATPQPLPPPPTPQDDVVTALLDFGISKRTAQKLAQAHTKEHILKQLDIVKWLVAEKSPLVAKNPAGFARRAIEEDYPPPPQYQSQKQRAQELQLRKNCTICEGTGYYRVAENTMSVCHHNARRGIQKPKPDSTPDSTIEPLWKQVLESLRGQAPPRQYETRLKDMKLLGLDGQTAIIGVADESAIAYLNRRWYQSIARTLERVLGQEVQVEFVVAPETT
jgi:hypothetical protein